MHSISPAHVFPSQLERQAHASPHKQESWVGLLPTPDATAFYGGYWLLGWGIAANIYGGQGPLVLPFIIIPKINNKKECINA